MRSYWVYLMANARDTILYVGITDHIFRRVQEHKQHLDPYALLARYRVEKLVWYEACTDIRAARKREQELKYGKRTLKERLIDAMNPERRDLALVDADG